MIVEKTLKFQSGFDRETLFQFIVAFLRTMDHDFDDAITECDDNKSLQIVVTFKFEQEESADAGNTTK